MEKFKKTPSIDGDFSSRVSQPTASQGPMKPLPRDTNALKEEAITLGLLGRNPTLKKPRAKLVHFLYSSWKIQRSMNYVSVLLVGNSGVGKSSTINHFLDTKGKTAFAQTHHSKSETRATEEFVMLGDEPRYQVSDLRLGVVDTPGFNDTDGSYQDACNLTSIKDFFETHPSLSGYYPNLILLVVKASDNRIEGENSNLGKSLRCIKQLGLVDPKHPNVVAVLSHACHVPYKRVAKWTEKLEVVKANVKEIIFKALSVTAPVVLLENCHGEDDHDLEISGDYTVLPNGVLQPKNLYEACAKVLKENEDHLGLITLNSIFASPQKNPPKPGHKIHAKNAKTCQLNAKEQEYAALLEVRARGGTCDFINDNISQYVQEQSLESHEEEEVRKIGTVLRKLGVKSQTNLGVLSIGSIEYFYGREISPTGRQMLHKKFNVPMEPPKTVFDSARLIGQGYNIVADKSVAAQVMKFEGVQTQYGIEIPNCAKFEKVQQTRSFMDVFGTEQSYTKARLRNLNVNLSVKGGILMASGRAGCNTNDNSSSSVSELSFLFEQRMFELKIGNYVVYLKKGMMTFTDDFESEVAKLPRKYDLDDPSCRNVFERFFNRFGHFLVSSAYGGGSVELKCSRETIGETKASVAEAKCNLAAAFEQVGGPKGEISASDSSSDGLNAKTLLSRCTDSWEGGDIMLHSKDTIADKEKMQNWKASLLANPTMLTSEMSLEPISTAVACVSKEKDAATYQALKDILGGEFENVADRKNYKLESNKQAASANTRQATTQQPESSWCILL